jgi:hypothetical protein
VTRGGISPKTGTWKPIFFKAKETEFYWRYTHIRKERDWRHFLDSQWYWKVHFTKKTNNILQTVSYLGRYLKRPLVSASRLHHYSKGGMLTFDYLNHRTGQIENLTLPPAALIERLVEHIPDKGFKMIRYYGFLSNRHRVRCYQKCMTP